MLSIEDLSSWMLSTEEKSLYVEDIKHLILSYLLKINMISTEDKLHTMDLQQITQAIYWR